MVRRRKSDRLADDGKAMHVSLHAAYGLQFQGMKGWDTFALQQNLGLGLGRILECILVS